MREFCSISSNVVFAQCSQSVLPAPPHRKEIFSFSPCVVQLYMGEIPDISINETPFIPMDKKKSPFFLPHSQGRFFSGFFILAIRLHSEHFHYGRPHEKCMSIIKMLFCTSFGLHSTLTHYPYKNTWNSYTECYTIIMTVKTKR